MNEVTYKIYNSVLQLSILVFTSFLVYFAFVYYPRAMNTYRNASLAQKPFIPPAQAISSRFPIETVNYRIVYESASETYYVFIQGDVLNEFVSNKNAADLAIKSALSEDSLCGLNIIYNSASGLSVSPRYLARSGC